jgi:hypothetical protein
MKKEKKQVIKKRLQNNWFGKFIYFIWYEDSVLSWLANIVLAFLIIKFIFYPLIGLLFGTNIPVVAVLSCSMQHDFTDCGTNSLDKLCGIAGSGNVDYDRYWLFCGDFYEKIGIDQNKFKEFPMSSGFNKGDIILLKGTEISDLEIGDIIVFNSLDRRYPIIHRIISIDEDNDFVQTKGDHNIDQIVDTGLNEKNIKESDILGKAFLRVPFLGYVKIWFSQLVSMLA